MSEKNEMLRKDYEELLGNALSNPGVKEVVELFAAQQRIVTAYSQAVSVMTIPSQMTMSTGTNIYKSN